MNYEFVVVDFNLLNFKQNLVNEERSKINSRILMKYPKLFKLVKEFELIFLLIQKILKQMNNYLKNNNLIKSFFFYIALNLIENRQSKISDQDLERLIRSKLHAILLILLDLDLKFYTASKIFTHYCILAASKIISQNLIINF